MKPSFQGFYFKHQKGRNTLAFIAGTSLDRSFIQVITENKSYCFSYSPAEYKRDKTVRIGGNVFSKEGTKVSIHEDGISIEGEIKYTDLTPLKYDIMGPFRLLPMQCRHEVISLHHRLDGSVRINGETLDFSGGTGYIEGDSGRAFPKSYAWFQCGDFAEKACVMASVADIPFAGARFCGCVACVFFGGIEYRLATYLGAKVLHCDESKIIIRQGTLQLEISMDRGEGQTLLAPRNGRMTREITERASCRAEMRLTKCERPLFERDSLHASCEYVR